MVFDCKTVQAAFERANASALNVESVFKAKID